MLWLFLYLLCAAAASLIAVTAHELGHLIAGLAVGFRFRLFAVGPLKIVPRGRHLVIRLNTDMSLATGITICCPVGGNNLRLRMAAFMLGGPLSNMLVALVLLVETRPSCLLAYHSRSGTEWNVLLATLDNATILFSLAVFAVNVLPLPIYVTDGRRAWNLLGRGSVAEREAALLQLYLSHREGVRPRDANVDAIMKATDVRDASTHEAIGNQFAYAWALDRGEVADAGRYLDRALALRNRISKPFLPALLFEAAYYTALYRGDAATARGYVRMSDRGTGVAPTLRVRAEAAMLAAEGKYEQAEELANTGLDRLAPSEERERQWLAAVLESGRVVGN